MDIEGDETEILIIVNLDWMERVMRQRRLRYAMQTGTTTKALGSDQPSN